MNDANAEWDNGIKTSGFHSACVNSWYRPMITEIDNMQFETVPAHDFYQTNKIDADIVNLIDDLLLHFRVIDASGPWIAGGVLRRALQGERLKDFKGDIDLFFKNEAQKEKVKQFISNNDVFKVSPLQQEAEDKGGVTITGARLVSPYAESIFYDYCGIPIKIQFITYKYYDTLPKLFTNFDTYCCMIGSDGANVTYEKTQAINDLNEKKLHFNWPHIESNPEQKANAYLLMKRLTKFIGDGYSIENNDLKRFTALIHNLPSATYSRAMNEYSNI